LAVNDKGRTPLHYLFKNTSYAKKDHFAAFIFNCPSATLQKALNVQDKEGETPMHALARGKIEKDKKKLFILFHKVGNPNINIEDFSGMTALEKIVASDMSDDEDPEFAHDLAVGNCKNDKLAKYRDTFPAINDSILNRKKKIEAVLMTSLY